MSSPVFAVKKINGTTLVDCRIALTTAKGTDLLTDGQATSDQRTEANSVAGWTGSDAALSSVTTHGGVVPFAGTYLMRILGNGGTGVVGEAQRSFSTSSGTKYRVRAAIHVPSGQATQVTIKIGTAAGGEQTKAFDVLMYAGWNLVEFDFAATASTHHLTIYGADNGVSIYADDVSIVKAVRGKFADAQKFKYPRRFLCATAWTDGTDKLKITDRDGNETELSVAASKGFGADTMYGDPEIAQFRSSGSNESGFEIICYY